MARRVFSGFITTPAGSSWAAQRVTGASQNEGEEDVGPATVAARQVAVQVRLGSYGRRRAIGGCMVGRLCRVRG